MADRDHDGHRGEFISQIEDHSNVGIYAAPNIVLLHAGTNDMYRDIDVSSAPARLKSLIKKILVHAPNAVVFVAQIIPSTTAAIQRRIEAFNDAVPDVVNSFDRHVILVPMNDVVSTEDISDNLHPNDIGYEKMAKKWLEVIETADEQGLISKPDKGKDPPPDTTGPNACQSTPSWYKVVGEIAKGAKAYGHLFPLIPLLL